MIFRKPYAFLIKYFKLINVLLATLSVYIAFRTYNIINFFNIYVKQHYSGNFYQGFYHNYISLSVYIIILLIIVGILVICALFFYKKKPMKAYLTSLMYYVLLLIFFNIIKDLMITLETDVITAEAARVYRDLSLISIVPQVLFIILFFIRGLGLNLGKFNFEADLKELEISEQDNEEVEINLKRDGTNLKRTLRRFVREFGYYIKENKFIFIIICVLIALGIGFFVYKSLPEIIDKEYRQGETFVIDNLTYRIEDSIVTNLDYKGDSFGEDIYFVVAKLYIENNTTENINFDYNNFRLVINDKYVYPSVDKGKNFIDYAVNYYGNTIASQSKQLYSLVFKIDKNSVNNNYKIKINNGTALKEGVNTGKFNYVTITPIVINQVSLERQYKQGEEISFNNSNLGLTSLTLSNTIISNKYSYKYEVCANKECNTYKDIVNIDFTKNDKTLIIIDYNYIIDKDVPFNMYSSDINKFADCFIKVKYLEDEEYKYALIENITPNKLKNKLVLETTNKIKNSDEVFISIIIRNKEYLINIK